VSPTKVVLLVLVSALVGDGCAPEHYAQRSRKAAVPEDTVTLMTNKDVIALSKSRVGDDVIVDMMGVSGSDFYLRPQDVVELADSGVSDKVISAMIKTAKSSQYTDESGGYYYSPPYYWDAGYPFWYPWYPAFSMGLSFGYYDPLYMRGYFAPFYGARVYRGYYGGHWSGGYHSGGRHR
jgi:hypothetical protein